MTNLFVRFAARVPLFLIPVLVIILWAVTACAPRRTGDLVASYPVVQNGDRATFTILFLGLSSKDGVGVSEQQWQTFLEQVVTPRFPDGLTVLDAYGQYASDSTVKIVRERTKLLLLVHGGDRDSQNDIVSLIAEYKRRFKQESVLRVDSKAQVKF